MNWIVFALLAALFSSIGNILSKRGLRYQDVYTVFWWRSFFTIPLMVLLLLINPIPTIYLEFWKIIAWFVPTSVLVEYLVLKGFEKAPVSLAFPFTAFTPLFTVISSLLILGEKPSLFGLLGILFIVLGVYLINLDIRKGLLTPLKKIITEKGLLYVIIGGALWGTIVPFGKVAVRYSSPTFFSATYLIIFALITTPIYFKKLKTANIGLLKHWPSHLLNGTSTGLVVILNWLAVNGGLASYATALYQSRILITVLLGGLLLKESEIRKRGLSASLILLGLILIVFSK